MNSKALAKGTQLLFGIDPSLFIYLFFLRIPNEPSEPQGSAPSGLSGKHSRYLSSIISEDGKIDEDVQHRIKAG